MTANKHIITKCKTITLTKAGHGELNHVGIFQTSEITDKRLLNGHWKRMTVDVMDMKETNNAYGRIQVKM